MAAGTILVVEDNQDILELISYNLRKEGYRVETAVSGEAALRWFGKDLPDLLLLDLLLPGMDGLEVCRRLKADRRTARVPIIMVTAKGEESDVVVGLELGADDYVTKPFRPRELVARVRAVLRRATTEPVGPTETVTVGSISIDPNTRQVRVAGKPVSMTFTEFEVLHFLARHPGIVFTRYQIVDAVRGQDYAVTDRSVDVQIVGLRKKLGEASRCIETVRGVGYRMRENPDR
jgi:two-component system phosphate regulon response regulator PhoB